MTEFDDIKIGLDEILNLFEIPFPRTISTMLTENKQIQVYSRTEALHYFEKSNYIDCRISAFGIDEINQERPNLIFVDLDDRTALNEVLALFHKEINSIPLAIDTGNGYAIIQPINIISLSNITLNNKKIFDVPKKFLLFAERYLTNNKCDIGNHPSLRSCLIRVPYSYNKKCLLQGKSREESKVFIYAEWNGQRAKVNNLPFIRYLDKLENQLQQKSNRNYTKGEIPYIEKLLQNSSLITDGKKRIHDLILCPYLINIKKLPIEQCEKILVSYFDNYISKNQTIYKLKDVEKKGIFPYSLKNMKINDSELYQIIQDSGVLD